MPELPDVEGLRRLLARTAAGRTVHAVHVPAPGILRNATAQSLGRAFHHARLARPHRHGKWLLAPAQDRAALLMHFGMDGGLVWADAGACAQPRDSYDRLILSCDGGELRYRSVRKLGGVWLLRNPGEAVAVTGPQGPDALTLDVDGLAARLAGRRGGVKPALLAQRVVAGLGNLTVDETLWRAGVHPASPVRVLGADGVRRLHAALQEVLRASVDAGRVPGWDGWLTGVRGERVPVCPRCGAVLARSRVAGRGTLWCPRCQPGQPSWRASASWTRGVTVAT